MVPKKRSALPRMFRQYGSARSFILYRHTLFRDMIARLVERESGVEIIGASDDFRETVAKIEEEEPDVVIIEGQPADPMDRGLLLQLALRLDLEKFRLLLCDFDGQQIASYERRSGVEPDQASFAAPVGNEQREDVGGAGAA